MINNCIRLLLTKMKISISILNQDTLLDNGEIDEILAKQQSQQFSSIILKNHSVTDAVQDKM